MKTLERISNEAILTSKKCDSPIYSFGKEMKPLEANVIENIVGNELCLSNIKNCYDSKFFVKLHKCYQKDELNYHYSLRKWHYINKEFGVVPSLKDKKDSNVGGKKLTLENISNTLKRIVVSIFDNK
jgi:hypothetical protein